MTYTPFIERSYSEASLKPEISPELLIMGFALKQVLVHTFKYFWQG
jgi:hypothetical protein